MKRLRPKWKQKWVLPLASTALLGGAIGIFQGAISNSLNSVFAADKEVEKTPSAKGGEKAADKTADKTAEAEKPKESAKENPKDAEKSGEGKKSGEAKKAEDGKKGDEAKDGKTVAAEAGEKEEGLDLDDEDRRMDANEKQGAVKRILAKNYQGCLTDEIALRDVQRARVELEKMKREVERREAEIAVREKAVQEELKKLDDAQKELKTVQGVLSAKDEEKIAKLVETFESMSPKAAAAIVGSLERKLAVQAMSKLSSQKLGKILSAMPTAKSSELTEALAGVVRADVDSRPSYGGSVTADAVKGGEKNANQQQQQQQLTNSVPVGKTSVEGQSVNRGREPASGGERIGGGKPTPAQ